MVRMSDLAAEERERFLSRKFPALPGQPFVQPPALDKARLAIVTTAGLQRRSDRAFDIRTGDYRVIPGEVEGRDLVMSHSSSNFDRTGFQQDVNIAFPIDRLREMERAGEIGSLGRFHYSFMSAFAQLSDFEPAAREVAGMLKRDKVDAVLLTPV